MKILAFVALVLATPIAEAGLAREEVRGWVIKKDHWSNLDEADYSEFISRIGEAVSHRKCRGLQSCLNDPTVNVYRGATRENFDFVADCAKLPYALRAYFAWKKNLPFAIVSDVGAVGDSNDIRYSRDGNEAYARTEFQSNTLERFRSGLSTVNFVVSHVSSANYRYDPRRESPRPDRAMDFYPPSMSRQSLKPGVNLYDPNGHVVVIYRVGDDGRVFYFDGHPDNSISFGTFGEKFVSSTVASGAGFKKWRPLRLVGAQLGAGGNLVGGHVVAARNAEIEDYSLVQVFGTRDSSESNSVALSWSSKSFERAGEPLNFYDYVRAELALESGPDRRVAYRPVDEVKNMLRDLCSDLQDRMIAVQTAINVGIDKGDEHPDSLPHNIYIADGSWEAYSTPSRDARLKTSFKALYDRVLSFVDRFDHNDPAIQYIGDRQSLVHDLLQAYAEMDQSCALSYKNSRGVEVPLTFSEVHRRLFLLSFDPYHCIERRWGATDARELSSCHDDGRELSWYEREQGLRNQIERTYEAEMGFNLEALAGLPPGSGVATAPETDFVKTLQEHP